MVDLVKHFETTKHLLDGGIVENPLRPYLGMSQLGNECARFLWYQLHWAYDDPISKRLKRLFQRGHREEPVLIKLLEDIGYVVNRPGLIEELCKLDNVSWDEAYDQLEFEYGFGHIKGHSDGVVENVVEAPKTPHLLEFKTASDSKFKQFKKVNNLEKSNPTYFGQVQLYMHFLKLKRTLWIVVNKNDDDIHIERIRYDAEKAIDLLRKTDHILMASFAPARAFPRTWYACKFCSAKGICWDKKPYERNCRTCQKSGIAHEGRWECNYWPDKPQHIPEDVQRVGCEHYLAITQED